MEKERIKEILETAQGKGALVLGDFCLDAYWIADMQRSSISLETPRFPRPIVEERYRPGAAGNVSWNLKDIGLEVYAVSLLGVDWRGELLKEALEEIGIHTQHLHSIPQRVTPAYIKPIIQSRESSQEDSRLDFDNYYVPEDELVERITVSLEDLVPKVEAVVLEDQLEYGLLSNQLMRETLNEMAAEYDKLFVVDSRNRILEFKNMVLKSNKLEVCQAIKQDVEAEGITPSVVKRSARKLYQRSKAPLFITADEEGVYIFDSQEQELFERIPTIAIPEPFDITGAGDTFMSGLVSSIIGGASMWEAGLVANIAASVSIKKVGETGTASPQEVLDRFEDFEEIIEQALR